MTHEERHRGTHPGDTLIFADAEVPKLRTALKDYCWLLNRGYAAPSSLKLVGDKFQLVERQRLLVMRNGSTENQRLNRQATQRIPIALAGQDLYLDGFNILITLESALSGGFIFIGNDGCYRDLASVHGTYKRVHETGRAITLIGKALCALRVARAFWLIDKPISNSGRLQQLLIQIAEQNGWNWDVELHQSPDTELSRTAGIIASSDSAILDSVNNWFHLTRYVIEQSIPDARIIDLHDGDAEISNGDHQAAS